MTAQCPCQYKTLEPFMLSASNRDVKKVYGLKAALRNRNPETRTQHGKARSLFKNPKGVTAASLGRKPQVLAQAT